MFRCSCDLLLKTGHTVHIHIDHTATSLGTKIKASVGTIFQATFGEFFVGGRLYKRVQQFVVGIKIEVLISTKPYNCMDLAQFSRQQVCGTDCVCK
jgi:hypothetical protein